MPKPSRLADHPRVALAGSERKAIAAAATPLAVAKTPRSNTKLTVSVIVKRRQPIQRGRRGPARITRAEYKAQHSADPASMALVRTFARQFNLTVEPDAAASLRRTMKLTGTVADMQKSFGVQFQHRDIDGTTYRVREGAIQLPAPLIGHVDAVLGLDNRPQAKPHFVIATPHASNVSYTPPQVAEAYQFPVGASANGQTIGLIELGGGFRASDITAYFRSLGLPVPSVTAVSVDGGKNAPSTASGADGEVMLDIEVAGSVAPGAKIVVYFAPNTDQGFIDAISTAVHDAANKPSVISISWGGPESSWTSQATTALDAACQSAAALGVTITAACGDNGSTDGVTDGQNHVDFPASSSHVLACGGTTLAATGATIQSEVTWNELANGEGATGGGVSELFPLPAWQAGAGVPTTPIGSAGLGSPARGLPDVAGDADPSTGYTIQVDGQTMVIGGTSAVAPLWAGLIAVANQQLGTNAGFINPTIYQAKASVGFNDITSGTNGAYNAGPGWDACTGLGSPIATALIPLLKAGAAASTASAKNKATPPPATAVARKPAAAARKSAARTKA